MTGGNGYAPGTEMFPRYRSNIAWVTEWAKKVQERNRAQPFDTAPQGTDANLPGQEQGYFGLSGLGNMGGGIPPGMGSQSNLMVGGLEQYRVQRMLQLLNQMGLF